MYAVIETGGKQYRVEVGTELEVELLDAEPGNTITLDRVLLVADGDDASIGRPLVADAAVSAEVLRQARGEKVISFKYRPKARRRVKKGHRQELTILRISDITLGGKSAAKVAKKADEDAKAERTRLEAAAEKQAAADAELAAKLAARTAEAEKTAGADEPAEAETKAGKPARKARAKAADKAETADATEATDTEAAEPKTPKRSRAKAAAADAGTGTADEAGAGDAAEAKPKRARATKKDE
jgi:large subunit ribosomal protein L21